MTHSRSAALSLASMLAFLPHSGAAAGNTGLLGTWQEPGGSVIHVERCGEDLCLKLVGLAKYVPSTVDGLNPDASLRSRPLCGLQIGRGFHLKGKEHADGGSLYDPKSGKTYKGSIDSDGDTLKLRGYVGFKAFGRSETWTRTGETAASCARS